MKEERLRRPGASNLKGKGHKKGKWKENDMVKPVRFSLLLSVFCLFSSFSFGAVVTQTFTVAAEADDGIATAAGLQSISDAHLAIGDNRTYSPPYQMSAMRFANIDIPRSATIISANLKIRSLDSEYRGNVEGVIRAEEVDNAPDYTGRNISDAPLTAAAVDWDHRTNWSANTWYTSPDIAPLIQQIIDRTGWNNNNAAALYYSTRTETGKQRFFAAFSTAPAQLEITYEYYTISGTVTTTTGPPLQGVQINAGPDIEGDVTDVSGYYEIIVPYNWSGQITANKIKWIITPESYSYADLISDQVDQDFSAAYIGTIIVKADGTGYVPNIQAAIDIAVDGDIVQVEDGTYTGSGNRDIDFLGKAITVRGNVADPNLVVIDCQGTEADPHQGVVFMSGEDANSILEGFTITNGRSQTGIYGGGICVEGSNPRINKCIISNNQSFLGAGIYVLNASPIITCCQINNNSSPPDMGSAGGMYIKNSSPYIEDCTFSGNYGNRYGGGMLNTNSSPTIINCRFLDNTSTYGGGGGMCNSGSSNPTIADCFFSGNYHNAGGGGGGIYNKIYSSPVITSCVFVGNSANGGSAIRNRHYSSPTITKCIFLDNNTGGGGTISNITFSSPIVTECTFSNNTANGGAGISNSDNCAPVISNCVFSNNLAEGRGSNPDQGGGGIWNIDSSPAIVDCSFFSNNARYGGGINNWNSSPTVTGCVFRENYADYGGGGIYNNSSSSPVIDDCFFEDNEARSHGGAVFNWASSPLFINSIFYSNRAEYYANSYGGAIYNLWDSSPEFIYCTFFSNYARKGYGVYNRLASAIIRNSILWDGSSEIFNDESSCIVTYSDVYGGYNGTGNINSNPLFKDQSNGDFHLKSEHGRWDPIMLQWVADEITSPCIDTGDPNDIRWQNELWPHGERINMGAFGGTPQASMSDNPVGNTADLNHDGRVDLADWSLWSDDWLKQKILLDSDFDRDNHVNPNDLNVFINNWLEGTGP